MNTIRSFEDLKCWQACRALRLFVAHEVLPKLPREEQYRLADQMIRAARSTTANIAEGYGRFHYMDNAKYCSNARGSCYEVLDHLIAGNDGGIVSDDLLVKGRTLVADAVRMINGYLNYLHKAGKQNVVRESSSEEIYAFPVCYDVAHPIAQ